MFNNKEYIGISYDGELIRIASVTLDKTGLKVERLDSIKPVTPLENALKQAQEDQVEEDPFDMMDTEADADSIFGLDDDTDEESDDFLDEIDLSDIEDDDTSDDSEMIDLVDESSVPESNVTLIHDFLKTYGNGKRFLALNVPSGDTIFQIISDSNYKERKKKELVDLIEDKLNSIYGGRPDKNNYDYLVRKDGSLVIASVDQESPTLKLLNDVRAAYNNGNFITDVVSDESVLVGLYRSNYEIEDDESITGLLQIGPKRSRMIFIRGHEVLQISPVINEGTKNKNYLNTIFSKLLFQLDTGEIPGLDKLLIFNNTEGNKALDFFRTSFSDLIVEDFKFNEEKVSFDSAIEKDPRQFTTTIGLAAIAAKHEIKSYPKLSFLPDYVTDQQKIFRLQWHGFILLILIGFSPVVLNHFYQQNASQIDSLQNQADRLQSSIIELRPGVQQAEELTAQLSTMQEQLDLLTELSEDNIRWSTTLDMFNRAVNQTGGLWINSFRQNEDVIMVDGYALRQSSIPELARKFEAVTLLNVRKQDIRERDVYFFTMMIREITDDNTLYTPGFARDFIQSNPTD